MNLPEDQQIQQVQQVQEHQHLPWVQSHQSLPWHQADHQHPKVEGEQKKQLLSGANLFLSECAVFLTASRSVEKLSLLQNNVSILNIEGLTGGPANPAGPEGPLSPRSPCWRNNERCFRVTES